MIYYLKKRVYKISEIIETFKKVNRYEWANESDWIKWKDDSSKCSVKIIIERNIDMYVYSFYNFDDSAFTTVNIEDIVDILNGVTEPIDNLIEKLNKL